MMTVGRRCCKPLLNQAVTSWATDEEDYLGTGSASRVGRYPVSLGGGSICSTLAHLVWFFQLKEPAADSGEPARTALLDIGHVRGKQHDHTEVAHRASPHQRLGHRVGRIGFLQLTPLRPRACIRQSPDDADHRALQVSSSKK